MKDNFFNIYIAAKPWFIDHGLRILVILILALVVKKITSYFIEKAVKKIIRGDNISKEAEEKRENTIIRIFDGTFGIVLWIVVLLMILSEFGVDIAPLIAGAGIIGLAVGFGGQYLIKDIFTGLFIILENQYRVGDIVSIGGQGGVVEDISLRVTVIRDLDGTQHYIPHGEIGVVSNKSKVFSRVNLNIGVAYEANIDKVKEVIDRVGIELSEDEAFKPYIIEAPKFLRVNEFADSSVVLKVLGETVPGKQWEIAGEYRKRLKEAFDKEGIEIPFPQMVISKKE